VRSIGAQKSFSGINSLPSDQLHPLTVAQVLASFESRQVDQTLSVTSLLTTAGWQKSVENNGFGSGVVGLSLIGSQEHCLLGRELHPLSSVKMLHGLALTELPVGSFHLQNPFLPSSTGGLVP
jgi:hypothetical protein